MHPLGLVGKIIRRASRASQLLADGLYSTEGTIVRCLALALVYKLEALPTCKDRTEIENCDAARTAPSRTEEPDSFPTVVAECPVQGNRIFRTLPVLPVPLVPVAEDNTVELSEHLNRPDNLSIDRPREVCPAPRLQKAFALQNANVQLAMVGGRVLGRMASQGRFSLLKSKS